MFFHVSTYFLNLRKQNSHPGLSSKIALNSFYENLLKVLLEISALSFSRKIFLGKLQALHKKEVFHLKFL